MLIKRQSKVCLHIGCSHPSRFTRPSFSIFRESYSETMSNCGVVLLNNSSLTVPLVPGVVQNSPNIVNTGMALAQRCPPPLIYSTTGYDVSTCTHSTGIRLASLTSVRQRAIALECAFVLLNGLSMHCHTYQKYSKSLQCKGTSLL